MKVQNEICFSIYFLAEIIHVFIDYNLEYCLFAFYLEDKFLHKTKEDLSENIKLRVYNLEAERRKDEVWKKQFLKQNEKKLNL